jgi:CheY-like chemotaxis protein
MSYKILLADDSITIQKVIGITLTSEEFQLIVADNGDEALEKAQKEKPSLIIADTNMPGLNGYELCEKIRSTPDLKNIPLILLVGTYETFDAERAKRAGANDHITKPFESQQLIKKIRELLKASAIPTPTAPTATPASPQREVSRQEPEEAIPLEPLELEELEPEPMEVELPASPPAPEEAPPLLEIAKPPEPEEIPSAPSLDFSDLEPTVSEPPSAPSAESAGEVTWNLEEFEGYLAQQAQETEAEKAPPQEEMAVELSFEETFSIPAEEVSPPSPPPPPEETPPSPPTLLPESPRPPFPPEPSLPPPPSPIPPPQPPPHLTQDLSAQIEERVRTLVTERITTLLEDILPKAIDEAIAQGVERVLRQMAKEWKKGSSG